jgi:hypothetical protein
VRRELQQARKQMAKDFVEKKQMIVDKLKELRSQKRSIEEIYKYTTDIILEEEDEDDEEEEELPKPTKKKSQSKLAKQTISVSPYTTNTIDA